jgi:hypothetical protein
MKWAALLFAVFVSLPAQASPAGFDFAGTARLCRTGSAKPVRDRRIFAAIAQAREQHRLFGGQLLARGGGIVRVGFHEAEFDRLKTETVPTWRRVAQFWAALDERLPSTFRSPDLNMVSRKLMLERIAGLNGANGLAPLDNRELDAIQSALLRSALVDHPWSAVFISFLMKTSGFGASEFEFSDSHVDYVDQAFATSAAETQGATAEAAYRACDVITTPPRAGDLICHTREDSAGITSFAALLQEIDARRAAAQRHEIPMHCDLVTSADEGGNAKIETVGGNVFQSVTLRQMTLNANKTLSAKYLQRPGTRSCNANAGCDRNLSRKPWAVLLQFRR